MGAWEHREGWVNGSFIWTNTAIYRRPVLFISKMGLLFVVIHSFDKSETIPTLFPKLLYFVSYQQNFLFVQRIVFCSHAHLNLMLYVSPEGMYHASKVSSATPHLAQQPTIVSSQNWSNTWTLYLTVFETFEADERIKGHFDGICFKNKWFAWWIPTNSVEVGWVTNYHEHNL